MGITQQQVLEFRKTNKYEPSKVSFPEKKGGVFSDIGEDIGQTFGALGKRATETYGKISDITKRQETGETGLAGGFLQSMGTLAGGISGGLGDLFTGAIKGVLSPEQEQSLKQKVEETTKKVIENPNINPIIKSSLMSWEKLKVENPELARNMESIFNVGMFATDVLGGGILGKGTSMAKKGIETGIKQSVKTGGELLATGVKTAKPLISGTTDLTKGTLRSISNLPTKIGTNLATKQAEIKAIESLPTSASRKAASLGLDVSDVNTILSIPPQVKGQVKNLVKSVQDFSSGVSKVRPEEVIGKPMVSALKELEKYGQSVGKKIGDVSKNLGVVSNKELFNPIFNRLKGVINGLEIKKGKLNFKNTVLTTSETATDRRAIQNIFDQAVKWGNGEKKHKLRQELFEILGGKKKSLANITATQEKAYEAIRKGLADVLDAKNSQYKSLSQEYAKTMSPLMDLRKMMKGTSGTDEDILQMSAGLLARRLTSNAPSNPQLRGILRTIDNVLKSKGKVLTNLETLQDVFNVLDKYYDIAAKTGFQGQIKSAIIDKGGDLASRFFDATTGMAKETPAVRRKALEDLLSEVLK